MKEEILKRSHFSSPTLKQKHVCRSEKDKIILTTKDGTELDDGTKTFAACGLKEGDTLIYTLKAPLVE